MKVKSNRFFILLSVAFLLAMGISDSVQAQSASSSYVPSCPTVIASSPDSVDAGQEIIFTINVSGGDPNVTPTYNWTVSAGTISSGQGTSSIRVDTTGVPSAITATGDVGGFARDCATSSSSTTSITQSARKIDEYGKIQEEDEQTRLDNYALEVGALPTDKGYIISYGGRQSVPGEAQNRLKAAKDYLVKKRGLDASKLVTLDGGYREEATTELWLVVQGAAPPMAQPSVDPSEVKMMKPSKKGSKTKKPVKKSANKTAKKKKS